MPPNKIPKTGRDKQNRALKTHHDMLLAQAIEGKREADARAIKAFGSDSK